MYVHSTDMLCAFGDFWHSLCKSSWTRLSYLAAGHKKATQVQDLQGCLPGDLYPLSPLSILHGGVAGVLTLENWHWMQSIKWEWAHSEKRVPSTIVPGHLMGRGMDELDSSLAGYFFRCQQCPLAGFFETGTTGLIPRSLNTKG